MCIFLFMVCLQLTLMKNCVPAARPYRASKSNYFFMMVLLLSYILSLIVLDFLLGVVALNSFVAVLAVQSVDASLIAFKVFYATYVTGFGLYLYPSFFLACDRYLVVLYPLKFKEYLGKMRVAKFVWISIHLINQISLSLFRFIFGVGSILYKVTSAVSTLLIILVTLGTCFLYVIMIVQIIRSSKKIAKSRARRSTSK